MARQRTRAGLQQTTREDDEDGEMVLLTIACALVRTIAGAISAPVALHADSREERGDYRRANLANLDYLHDNAEDIAIFQRKYSMDKPTCNKLVQVLEPFLGRCRGAHAERQ